VVGASELARTGIDLDLAVQSCAVELDVSVQPFSYLAAAAAAAAAANAGSDLCGVAKFLRGGWTVFFSDELAAFRRGSSACEVLSRGCAVGSSFHSSTLP